MSREKPLILIVDDSFVDRQILKNIVKNDYAVIEAENGRQAMDIIEKMSDDIMLIMSDLVMPEVDGYGLLEWRLGREKARSIPLICITSSNREATETKILSLGAEDYIVKPFSKDVVRARIDTHVKLKVYRDRLTGMIDEGVSKLEHIHNSVLLTLADVTEYRNLESGDHIRRTQQMTAVLMSAISGQEWFLQKYGNENIGAIVRVSVLHDIGKIGIRDDIILKPGRLTSGEFAEIKRHAEIGEKIAEQFFPDGAGFVRYCKQICRSHHERWDGGGYPDGLKGEEIPLSARVVAIVDVLDTLVSDRVYKKAISFDEAIGIIEGERGRQFDPVLVDAALGVRSELENICRSVK